MDNYHSQGVPALPAANSEDEYGTTSSEEERKHGTIRNLPLLQNQSEENHTQRTPASPAGNWIAGKWGKSYYNGRTVFITMVILQLPAKLESEPSLTTGAGSACGTVQHVDGKRIEDLVIRTCRKAHQKTKSIIYSYSIHFHNC